MHSRNSSYSPSRTVPNWIPIALLAVSLVGFVDATYLTVKHYSGGGLECPIFEGCEQVTTSPYATLAGVPVALLGAIYYLAILLSVVSYLDTQRESILFLTARFTVIGFIASIWFVYLQVFVIQAICFYCMVSAVTSTLLFLLGMLALRYRSIS